MAGAEHRRCRTMRTVDLVWTGVTLITPGIKLQRNVLRVRFAVTRCTRAFTPDNSITRAFHQAILLAECHIVISSLAEVK